MLLLLLRGPCPQNHCSTVSIVSSPPTTLLRCIQVCDTLRQINSTWRNFPDLEVLCGRRLFCPLVKHWVFLFLIPAPFQGIWKCAEFCKEKKANSVSMLWKSQNSSLHSTKFPLRKYQKLIIARSSLNTRRRNGKVEMGATPRCDTLIYTCQTYLNPQMSSERASQHTDMARWILSLAQLPGLFSMRSGEGDLVIQKKMYMWIQNVCLCKWMSM